MNWAGYAGVAMIVVGVLAVLFAVVSSLPAVLRARRASAETTRLLAMYRLLIESQVAERDHLLAEQELIARPLKRIVRVATHPLALALFESYRLRRRRAREAVL